MIRGGERGIRALDRIVESPIAAINVEVNVVSVRCHYSHRASALVRKRVANVCRATAIVRPGVVAVRAKDKVVEFIGRVSSEQRIVQSSLAVRFSKDHAERFL